VKDVIYDKMTAVIGRRGGGLPSVRCKEFDAIIDDLFSAEEAEMVVQMPDDPVSAQMMASITGLNMKRAGELLEAMTSRGVLMCFDRDDTRFYHLMPLLPGLYEFHFITGATDDHAKRAARLFLNYVEAVEKLETAAPGIYPKVPWARVVPVNMDVTSKIQVKTFDQLLRYIEKAKYVGVSNCFCRHMGDLLDDPCDKPKDVCMSVGPGALFLEQRGFGKLISKEEAYKILERSEEAGLVHCVSNTGKYIDFICNCCTCHCHILRNVNNSSVPSFVASSSVLASVNAEECIDCEACIERCPMGALVAGEDTVSVDNKRCIGCGLCLRSCPSDAITLRDRPDAPTPSDDTKILNQRIVASKKMAS
jgi:electron transport complex protein RnfB